MYVEGSHVYLKLDIHGPITFNISLIKVLISVELWIL